MGFLNGGTYMNLNKVYSVTIDTKLSRCLGKRYSLRSSPSFLFHQKDFEGETFMC